jgi:excisionase family DNA binding protein
MIMEKTWFTIRDAAEYLGVSTKYIRELLVDGLHYYKVRHTCFVSKSELDEYILSHKVL